MFFLGLIAGITVVIVTRHTWRGFLGWALSRGDTPKPDRGRR